MTMLVVTAAGCSSSHPSLAPEMPSPDRPNRIPVVVTEAERTAERRVKESRLSAYMRDRDLDAVVFTTERNLNWITAGGENNIVHAQREAGQKLVFIREGPQTFDKYCVCPNFEYPRLRDEEFVGMGYRFQPFIWHDGEETTLSSLLANRRTAADGPLTAPVAQVVRGDVFEVDSAALWYPLTTSEIKKYKWLGRKSAEILDALARSIEPGLTEFDLQYLIEKEFWYWDIFPTVNLVAVDDRPVKYKHNPPVGARFEHYCNLNVCVRKWGLVLSFSRLVWVGDRNAELDRLELAFEKNARIAAVMWHASRPGATLGDVIRAARQAYADEGEPDAWDAHHLGGMVGYIERINLAGPDDPTPIVSGMSLAWNPTVDGAKVEDTFIVTPAGADPIAPVLEDWPVIEVEIEGTIYRMPGLLVRED
jgi:Xaa-Pro aminopeptidase